MKVGFIGLGRMGYPMVARLRSSSHDVVAYDIDPAAVKRVKRLGATPVTEHGELIAALGRKPVVWLMIPAPYVDNELKKLLPLLPKGSIIIDGGNSDYRKTLQRYSRCQEKGVELVDVGTSGGVLGLKHGFSMMVGGEPDAVRYAEPLIKSLAQTQGYKHFGPTGTGHYIKMVHNAIEYGVMEAYAEGYRLLHDGPIRDLDLAGIANVWQQGSIIASSLNGMAGDILRRHPQLDHTDGVVASTGEAGWALEVANQMGLEMPAIRVSADARQESQRGAVTFGTRLLAALRYAFGGHPLHHETSKENK